MEPIAEIAVLDQPLRRDLYRHLAQAAAWVSRDDAAAALDVPRSVAAFHLDKLADAGLVEVRFERTSGRQGPGAGRPSKLYRRHRDEIAASVPERHYDLAGRLLADAVARSTGTGAPVRDCLREVAHAAGEAMGAESGDGGRDDVLAVLAEHGYEPEVGADGEIALVNCPFHRLAEAQRDLVCGMNLDLLEGLLDGIAPADPLTARLEPSPGHCCVRLAVP